MYGYVRPEDIPLLDRSILEPIVGQVAREMAEAYPDQSVEEWVDDLQRALIRGDVLIVIDDVRKRVGLVRADRPPFLGLVSPLARAGAPSAEALDPLDLKRWERGTEPPRSHQEKGGDGRES
jgi:hypothetical protein